MDTHKDPSTTLSEDYSNTLSMPPLTGTPNKPLFPVLSQQAIRQFHHDVLGFQTGIRFIAGQALLAGRTGSQQPDISAAGMLLSRQPLDTRLQLLPFAKAHLGRDVRP